jgi:hypothetical protein
MCNNSSQAMVIRESLVQRHWATCGLWHAHVPNRHSRRVLLYQRRVHLSTYDDSNLTNRSHICHRVVAYLEILFS